MGDFDWHTLYVADQRQRLHIVHSSLFHVKVNNFMAAHAAPACQIESTLLTVTIPCAEHPSIVAHALNPPATECATSLSLALVATLGLVAQTHATSVASPNETEPPILACTIKVRPLDTVIHVRDPGWHTTNKNPAHTITCKSHPTHQPSQTSTQSTILLLLLLL